MAALLMNMAVELLRSEELPTLDERISRNIMHVYEALLHVNEDVEGRQVRDSDVKKLLESIKDLCYDVVDMLEGLKIQKAKTVHFLNQPASLLNLLPQRGHRKLMDVLNNLVKILSSDRDKLGLKTSLNQLTLDRRMSLESQRDAAPISTPNLRGRVLESSTLVDTLLNKDGQMQGHIRCISVVGEAGIGKTELAHLVYNDKDVNAQFQLKAWIYVSKEFNMSKIALFLLRSLTSNTIHNQFGLESLFQRIVGIIRGKKCLFVLDDVRSENGYNWEQLRSLLSHGAPGSTYLITTRKKAVAQAAGSRKTDFFPLSCLSEQDCWSIAMERASITADSEAEKFFSEFSAVIERKCLGLPLNAKSLGDSLRDTSSSPGTVEGWRELIESLVLEAIDSDEEEECGIHSGAIQREWEKSAKQPTASLVLKSAIHGRDDELSDLIAKLCRNDDQVQGIRTISIVGSAGIGKTALAQLVYNSDEVNNHFELKSWVYVSRPFNLQYIARAMLECFTSDPIHGLELDSLFWRIRDFIRGKRYLFVLDHAWSQDYHKWEQLKRYLDCGALGSTLLISTRKMDVARAARSNEMDIIHLQNLEEPFWLSIIKDELSIFSDPEKVFQRYSNYITLKSRGVPHIAKNLCFNLGRAPPFSKEWQLFERDLSAAPTGFQNPTMEDELTDDSSNEEEREDERASQPMTSLVHAATIRGRDDVTGSLIQKLLSNDGQEEHIQFISIVGDAGIGKTAVAQLVYNTSDVVDSFNCRAWVFVGEEFNLIRIVRSIIESLTAKPSNETELVALLLTFRQIVDQRRCLFVLDDIWLEDDDQWKELKHLFNFTDSGSRALITTRNKSIAEKNCSEKNIVILDPLSESDCWSIIKDYAFGHSVNETKAKDFFNNVGKDIVQKCKGVPLMAKSLGNILRGKNSIQEWQEVLASETWDSADLMSSVMLSYLSMPPELRQFLLYCSIFPKNHSIDVGKLIKLWMAQGFIASNENEMEREGWKYIKQLLDRNIFQEFGPDSHGCFKCKLESGMSDLIHFLAKNESHRVPIDYMKDARVTDDPKICRHCTLIVAAQSSLPESIHNAKKLHTLMILSEYCFADPATLARVLSHLKVIRALDLSSCLIKELPPNIGELSLLRYLDLSFNRDLKKLPKAICSLLHLQTLNLNGCDRLRKLPKGIGNLIHLRHLEILWMTSLSYLPKGVANLTSLRTLSRFIGSSVAGSKACNLGDLKELNLIQGSITIDGLGGQTCASEASKACLKDKKDLLGLELCFSSVGSENNDDEGVLNALEAPPELQCLEIFFYRGQLLPDWIKTLRNLRHLILAHWSECNILPSLGHLPSLESLEIKYMPKVKSVGSEFLQLPLENAVSSDQVSSSTASFPRLQKLCFEVLNGWEDWSGNGSHANIMPSLSALSIENCPNLRTLPEYILEKKDLKRDIKNCPTLEVNNNNSSSSKK